MKRSREPVAFQRLKEMAECDFGVRIKQNSDQIFGFFVFDGQLFKFGSVKYLQADITAECMFETSAKSLFVH